MNITVAIMAHPKRQHQAELLLMKLTPYPFMQVQIVWDEQNNEWHTGERSMRAGAVAGADWHVVLQDDAIISEFFYSQLVEAIKNVPVRTLISLYTGTARPLGARVKLAVDRVNKSGFSWIRHYMLLWGVGLAIPTAHIEPMLEFVEGRKEDYDIRIGMFYQQNIIPIFYSNPSLVDHDDDLGSLLGHGQAPAPRRAHNFLRGAPNWNSNFIDL